MRMEIALLCLLLSACAPAGYQFSEPEGKKNDFDLAYKESLPGVAVNLDGYRE